MQLRHEFKLELSYADFISVKSRLKAVMRPDEHVSEKGFYEIRSLYFDNAADKALIEKINGLPDREKFRIRFYDNDKSFIRLEKKIKKGGLGCKLSAPISEDEAVKLLRGDTGWMKSRNDALISELHEKMKLQGLRPKTIVDYKREPYVYPAGNVRVTLDHDIRTGVYGTDIFGGGTVTVPVCPGSCIMEVKYDNFLPDMIRDIIQLKYREGGAFSKYGSCRVYG